MNLFSNLSKKQNYALCLYGRFHHKLKVRSPLVLNQLTFRNEMVNERVEANLKRQDKIPDSFRIIYRAPIKSYVKVSYTSAFLSAVLMAPLLSWSAIVSALEEYPVTVGDMTLINNFTEHCGLTVACLVVIGQITYIVFKYPFRIYKDSEKKHYIAVFQHLLPWKNRNKEFTAGQAKKVTAGFFPWTDSFYIIDNKKAILIEGHFYKPADLIEMIADKENSKQT